jgi:hypothetical protein
MFSHLSLSNICNHDNEEVGSSGNGSDLYPEDTWFESWLGHQLS